MRPHSWAPSRMRRLCLYRRSLIRHVWHPGGGNHLCTTNLQKFSLLPTSRSMWECNRHQHCNNISLEIARKLFFSIVYMSSWIVHLDMMAYYNTTSVIHHVFIFLIALKHLWFMIFVYIHKLCVVGGENFPLHVSRYKSKLYTLRVTHCCIDAEQQGLDCQYLSW